MQSIGAIRATFSITVTGMLVKQATSATDPNVHRLSRHNKTPTSLKFLRLEKGKEQMHIAIKN
jgi:hypothetical protein